MVAPQLAVVANTTVQLGIEALVRGVTPLWWCPTRRRHGKRQQYLDRPAMIGDPAAMSGVTPLPHPRLVCEGNLVFIATRLHYGYIWRL
jgi:hypothetical protein